MINISKKGESRPISRVLSWTTIHLGHSSPNDSSSLPECNTGRVTALLFGLAPSGVYPATDVTISAVRSYRTISPLPTEVGGIFSVALSIDSRRPGVTWHSALWSPDFPLEIKFRAVVWPTFTGYFNLSGQLLYIVIRLSFVPIFVFPVPVHTMRSSFLR